MSHSTALENSLAGLTGVQVTPFQAEPQAFQPAKQVSLAGGATRGYAATVRDKVIKSPMSQFAMGKLMRYDTVECVKQTLALSHRLQVLQGDRKSTRLNSSH